MYSMYNVHTTVYTHSHIHTCTVFQLLDQLVHKEKELQRREVEEELSEEQREARGWERPAGEEDEERRSRGRRMLGFTLLSIRSDPSTC